MEKLIPHNCGQSVFFEVRGETFELKKKRAGVYYLAKISDNSRARWGNKADIRKDLNHVLETGSLPVSTFQG
jgi:hypothetical protein